MLSPAILQLKCIYLVSANNIEHTEAELLVKIIQVSHYVIQGTTWVPIKQDHLVDLYQICSNYGPSPKKLFRPRRLHFQKG